MSANESLRIAIEHHQQGRLAEAEAIYREILSANGHCADAWHLLGVLALQVGHAEAAIELIRRALSLQPATASYLSNLGLAYDKANRLEEAVTAFRSAIDLEPSYVEAINNLGLSLRKSRQLEEADRYLEKATRLAPNYAQAWNNWGLVAKDQNNLLQAEHRFERAIALQPNYEDAWNNLGTLALQRHDFEKALRCHRHVLSNNPSNALAYHGLGSVYFSRGEFLAAKQAVEQAITAQPAHAESWNNLGGIFHELGNYQEAVQAFHRAIALDEQEANFQFNLGRTLSLEERYAEAIEHFQAAVALNPKHAEAWSSLALQHQHLCRWNGLDSIYHKLIEFVRMPAPNRPSELVNPSTFLVILEPTSWELQYRCARNWANAKYPTSQVETRDPVLPSFNKQAPKARLRLGYVSGDFRKHVMATHLVSLFEAHDRTQFEVFGYSIGPNDKSSIRQRIEQGMDTFVDALAYSTDQLVQRIQADSIDILIDLQGYTLYARPQVFAQRPAPIQVSYLGFAGSVGADWMDYVLVDDFVVPRAAQPYFSEKLVHLPGCYQVNDSATKIAEPMVARKDCDLPEDGFVFCCFNNCFKISPSIFDVWMRLLDAAPGSVLWLPEWHPESRSNLVVEARNRGVDSQRLVFAPYRPLDQHLQRQSLADLFLDTFPFNAHGTASIALRCGVPIVTLSGHQMASRVAGSLLKQLGFEDLITYSIDDYENKARALATDRHAYREVRQRLAKNLVNNALFDPHDFAKKLESAFLEMAANCPLLSGH
jgi:protein O-GlcNAc transferase